MLERTAIGARLARLDLGSNLMSRHVKASGVQPCCKVVILPGHWRMRRLSHHCSESLTCGRFKGPRSLLLAPTVRR